MIRNHTFLMQGVAVVFIAQAYGIPLTMGNLATVVVTATLASIGTAGVPSVGLVTLAMVLNSVGLPTEGIVLNQLTNRRDTDRIKLTGSEEAMAEML